MKDENRKLNRINTIRMREKIRERVTREEQSKSDSWKMREREMLFWGERMEFLRRHLRPEDWEVLYERLGEPQQSRKEYAKQHGISDGAAKKRLTRAKDRAAKLLMENGTDTNGI